MGDYTPSRVVLVEFLATGGTCAHDLLPCIVGPSLAPWRVFQTVRLWPHILPIACRGWEQGQIAQWTIQSIG